MGHLGFLGSSKRDQTLIRKVCHHQTSMVPSAKNSINPPSSVNSNHGFFVFSAFHSFLCLTKDFSLSYLHALDNSSAPQLLQGLASQHLPKGAILRSHSESHGWKTAQSQPRSASPSPKPVAGRAVPSSARSPGPGLLQPEFVGRIGNALLRSSQRELSMEWQSLNCFPSLLRMWHGRNHTGPAAACWCPAPRAAHARIDRKIHPRTANSSATRFHPGQAALTLVQTCLIHSGSTFSTPLEIRCVGERKKSDLGSTSNTCIEMHMRIPKFN